MNKCFNEHLKSVIDAVNAFQFSGVPLNMVTETIQKQIDQFKMTSMRH